MPKNKNHVSIKTSKLITSAPIEWVQTVGHIDKIKRACHTRDEFNKCTGWIRPDKHRSNKLTRPRYRGLSGHLRTITTLIKPSRVRVKLG